MPKRSYTYKKRKSTTYRKKSYPFKRRKSYKKKMIKSQGTWKTRVAPTILKVKMFYHTINIFDSTQVENYQMSGNSVYDPDYTNVGTSSKQPINYDDLVAFYDEYIVVGSKVKATFTNNGIQSARCYIHASPYPTAFDALTYDPYAQMNTAVCVVGNSTGGHDIKTLKMYRSTKAMYGIDPKYNQNFAASTSGNPTTRWFWNIGVYDQTSTDTALNIEGDISVTYYVVLRKRKAQESYD